MVTKKRPDDGKEILNASEACFVMGLSWNTLRGLLNNGDIRHRVVGNGKRPRYLIPRRAIDEYFESERQESKLIVQDILKTLYG